MSNNAVFDVNFRYPVRELENDLVRLMPFIPEIHSEPFVAATIDHPSLFKPMKIGPFHDAAQFTQTFVEPQMIRDPSAVLFAVYDKTRENTFAATIGYVHTSEAHASLELGVGIVFPAFQKTHVTSNAIALLLKYALDSPDPSFISPTGTPKFTNSANSEAHVSALGLRRVQWCTPDINIDSMRAAQRMGFKIEGVTRWIVALREDKAGLVIPPEKGRRGGSKPGVHATTLAICWDDWEGGVRDVVLKAMELRVGDTVPVPSKL